MRSERSYSDVPMPQTRLTLASGADRFQADEIREDWFVVAPDSEVGPPESSLHLMNLLDSGQIRKRTLTQRVKDKVRKKFGR